MPAPVYTLLSKTAIKQATIWVNQESVAEWVTSGVGGGASSAKLAASRVCSGTSRTWPSGCVFGPLGAYRASPVGTLRASTQARRKLVQKELDLPFQLGEKMRSAREKWEKALPALPKPGNFLEKFRPPWAITVTTSLSLQRGLGSQTPQHC